MPAGHPEYALPYIFPWPALAAAFTAQWQAQETSEERPAAMSSRPPPPTGPSAARATGGGPPAPGSVGGRADRGGPHGEPVGLEDVLQALGREEAVLLGHPLLQPHVRLDREHHQCSPSVPADEPHPQVLTGSAAGPRSGVGECGKVACMPNRLAGATSPYLLQHADNPVDWREGGEEAFAEARERDVPLLISVGYAACHWCHVMAHESFEDEETAAQMNAGFVCVKVDREERPDVDSVYMAATQALTRPGGRPNAAFHTPDGKPFYCGTYYPPRPAPGMPAFRQVLAAMTDAWRTRREELETAS